MASALGYYLVATGIVMVLVVLYWTRPQQQRTAAGKSKRLAGLLAFVTLGLGLCLWSVWLERPTHVFERQISPIAIAIAFDLSPSMLATPDPNFDGAFPPRFERGKNVLLELFRGLEERRIPVIVSVLGFTKKADVLMGWDQSLTQVRDTIEYALSPDLFGSSGTSFEAATGTLTDVFAMLPEEIDSSSRKIAIVVSDGEDTMRASSFGYAQEQLAEEHFDTIALHTGMLDKNEGIPTYDRVGGFSGFRDMSGSLYTVPDTQAMANIADASSGRGLYVRAESAEAVETLLAFVDSGSVQRTALDASWLATLGMLIVLLSLSALIIR